MTQWFIVPKGDAVLLYPNSHDQRGVGRKKTKFDLRFASVQSDRSGREQERAGESTRGYRSTIVNIAVNIASNNGWMASFGSRSECHAQECLVNACKSCFISYSPCRSVRWTCLYTRPIDSDTTIPGSMVD